MKALVVGGGVGGPAVALFLRRLWLGRRDHRGSETAGRARRRLLERRDERPRGPDRARGHRPTADRRPSLPPMVMWSGSGKRLGEVPNGPAGQPERGSVIVRRGWLQQVLREAAIEANVPVTFGARLASLEEHPRGMLATTTDGRLFDADLVIGADGIGSVTRRFVDPAASEPTYSGLVGLGGFAHGTGLEPTPGHQHFVFGRRSFFGYLVRDDGTVYWFANSTRPEPSREDLRAMPGRGLAGRVEGAPSRRCAAGSADPGVGGRRPWAPIRSTT